ncbi:hypothetical protein BKA65DRAFT_181116 [Rhexocercosporidium sp. MPI-PUGE-AT-0058]|nr:hypothetical protein BKA65DRAFT_181116 [Rhexocercosporidium sp. MPI-PUGE-AT-0058]
MIPPLGEIGGYVQTHSSFNGDLTLPLFFTHPLLTGEDSSNKPPSTNSPNSTHSSLFLTPPATSPWSSESFSPCYSSPLTPSIQPSSSEIKLTVASQNKFPVQCHWESCLKVFRTKTDLNHHLRYHSKPFQCPHCPLKQATKRHLDRHINERHFSTEKYYCTTIGCSRSINGGAGNINGGLCFKREDNCRRHMRNVHGVSGTDGVAAESLSGGLCGLGSEVCDRGGVSMDESSRRIRMGRKVGGVKLERMRAM